MGNRLLLVDDSITIQKVVSVIFASEGFELTVLDNAARAYEKALELRPDLILIDALMPYKSGYDVCTDIRHDPDIFSTPILLLIGTFETFDEEKALESGADAFITKPFESQQLLDQVKELLEIGKKRAADEVAKTNAKASSADDVWGSLTDVVEVSYEDDLWSAFELDDDKPNRFSESAVVDALKSLSKETIERIVREIVPDIAEKLIMEEINKIKSAASA